MFALGPFLDYAVLFFAFFLKFLVVLLLFRGLLSPVFNVFLSAIYSGKDVGDVGSFMFVLQACAESSPIPVDSEDLADVLLFSAGILSILLLSERRSITSISSLYIESMHPWRIRVGASTWFSVCVPID